LRPGYPAKREQIIRIARCEQKCTGNVFEHTSGDLNTAALFEPCVPSDADAGERSDLPRVANPACDVSNRRASLRCEE
jgi:hypothetical protein